ncbi:MAG: helix-turn-helix domain-containing protein, partial [Treponema sp.]|nr:helix-turn-helix domain-containing protein [Treponema sp.]
MESYGALLKKTREDLNLSIEEVETKTSITRQYIEGLEEEKNEAFPGEPYMVGFLKNYADFLGLKSDDVLKLYHAKKIQESPVPVELLQKKKKKYLVPLIVTLSILAVAGIGCYLYYGVFKIPQQKLEKERQIAETKKVHQYTFSGQTETNRLYEGDQILVPSKEGDGNIPLVVKNTVGSLLVQTPAGDQKVDLGEERPLDIDGDSLPDVILYVSDVDTRDGSRGAQVRMLLQDEDLIPQPVSTIIKEDENGEEITVPIEAVSDNAKQTVIYESDRAFPFTLTVAFRNACLFRHRVDRNENVENHFTSNRQALTLSAKNGIRIWTSKINAVSLQVSEGTQNIAIE